MHTRANTNTDVYWIKYNRYIEQHWDEYHDSNRIHIAEQRNPFLTLCGASIPRDEGKQRNKGWFLSRNGATRYSVDGFCRKCGKIDNRPEETWA